MANLRLSGVSLESAPNYLLTSPEPFPYAARARRQDRYLMRRGRLLGKAPSGLIDLDTAHRTSLANKSVGITFSVGCGRQWAITYLPPLG